RHGRVFQVVIVAASSSSGQQPTPQPRAAVGPERLAVAASPLIALSRDPQLLAAVKMVTGPGREVRTAGSEVDLSGMLVAHHAAVLLIAGAAIAMPGAT